MRRLFHGGLALLGLGLAAVAWPPPALSQSDDEVRALREEVERLKEGQKALQRQLDQIEALLRGRPGRGPVGEVEVEVDVTGAAALGDENATLTLVEFSDYQCPFCRRHARATVPALIKEYVESGKLRYVYRDFPIERIHPAAFEAAMAARCAGEQGKYWELHDRFFDQPAATAIRDWPGHAEALGLDLDALRTCLDSERYAPRVRQDLDAGRRAGVRGTPTFFIGRTEPGAATMTAARRIVGAQPYRRFKEEIDALLAQDDAG